MKNIGIRLALRQEGRMWNAYVAEQGTMEGAQLVGSIVMAAVANNLQRRQAFIDMMSGLLAEMIEAATGFRPDMEINPAPEGEKSGNA